LTKGLTSRLPSPLTQVNCIVEVLLGLWEVIYPVLIQVSIVSGDLVLTFNVTHESVGLCPVIVSGSPSRNKCNGLIEEAKGSLVISLLCFLHSSELIIFRKLNGFGWKVLRFVCKYKNIGVPSFLDGFCGGFAQQPFLL
jgi:hypothetical protein